MNILPQVLFLPALLLLTACTSRPSAEETAAINPDWTNLFADHTLDGWDKSGIFNASVEEGVLTMSDVEESGWLLSKKTYANFRLEADFRLSQKDDSGIAVRIPDQGADNPGESGYEINLSHSPDQQNPTGSLAGLARAKWLEDLDSTGWNKLAVEAEGSHLKVWLNEQQVTETHANRSPKGRIAFQANAGNGASEISFRNMRIKEMPGSAGAEPLMEEEIRASAKDGQALFPDDSFEGWQPRGTGNWEIEDGIIHGYGGEEGGFLVSEKAYKNFYLSIQFKIRKEDNSGIFIRQDPDSAAINLQTGIECNIYDHNGFSHAYSTGSIVSHARAFSMLIDYEDWNSMEIMAKDDHIILTINGKKSSEYHFGDQFNRPGNICLQAGVRVFTDGGPSEIWFREAYLKELD